jgi:hypothetical protein
MIDGVPLMLEVHPYPRSAPSAEASKKTATAANILQKPSSSNVLRRTRHSQNGAIVPV